MKFTKQIFTTILLLNIWSCSAIKKVSATKKETSTTEKNEVKKDSINTTLINKPIADILTIPVVRSNTNNVVKDSIINSKVDEILSKLNTTKKSGSNSYKVNYDNKKKLIELQASIGETKNTIIDTKTEEKTEKTFEEKTDEYLSKKMSRIPWWFYVLAFLWFLPQILKRVIAITNPVYAFFKK